ncbi:MAG: ATP-grasp domain-containing protein [Gemmatimonadaceae bacterium]
MTTRVAVTGAGGPSAVSFLEAVAAPSIELFAGDIDPYASGLYLVPPENRWMLRRGADPSFVDDILERSVASKVDVLVPTVDFELLPMARRREEFAREGIKLVLANAGTLELCLDKAALLRACDGACAVPRTCVLDERFDLTAWTVPFLVKPRLGAGGRGVQRIDRVEALALLPHDGSMIVQEFLGGREYSVDVLSTPAAQVLAVVPRARLKIDSGIAVTGVTLHDERLDSAARAVAKAVGLTFVANVQFREDAAGVPRLMDVNARFPGTMPLTVAAGVNMPRLALDLVLGRSLSSGVGAFRDLGMVRVWREHFVEVDEIEQLEAAARAQHIGERR